MSGYDFVRTRREDVKPLPNIGPKAERFRRGMKFYTRLNALVFMLSGGRLMNTAMGGYPVCLVTLTGAKTGKRRDIPLIHVAHGEEKLLVGSQAGLDRHPAWVYSLRANPDIVITADGEKRSYRAREVDLEEKARLWPHLLSVYPAYDEYQARTDRNIPVFVCEPARGTRRSAAADN
ncbi:MAG: nitroreductase family deazaflavin-dependent oxidoreductase [Halioglobus sp.]|nr:nitroreductase family deazaflavin-dependent oxidoreductase [Halioglobus sp.]